MMCSSGVGNTVLCYGNDFLHLRFQFDAFDCQLSAVLHVGCGGVLFVAVGR